MDSVSPSLTSSSPDYTLAVPRASRWQIYQRLQDLDIDCICLPDGTLKAAVVHPVAMAQIWSVVQQSLSSRQQLVGWLETCWQQSGDRPR
ncbi:MAG TPA: Asr1405/Asl0597 family protein [Chroococcidiopsis sp.]